MELPLSRHARPFRVSLRWSQENHCGAVGGHIRRATTYSGSRERFAGRQTFWCVGWWVGKYLRPSACVARPRFIRRTIFQAETRSLERSAHACGQAQVTGHSISRLGADRSPASRTEADRERGCFTIGGRPVTFELNMNMPPNKCAPANRRYGFSARSGIRSNYSASKMPNNSAHF